MPMPNLKSVRLKTKELLRFHSGCHGMKISLVSNQNVASAARDLVLTSKKPLSFTNCLVNCEYALIIVFINLKLKPIKLILVDLA